jgi:TonB-dependent Receptor Plug Domain/CarboxypepD_reg-like domain
MNKYFFLFLLLLPFHLQSQKVTISGFVRDFETNEPLPGAVIEIQNASINAIANNFGFFSLTLLSKDSISLLVHYVSYPNTILNISGRKNQSIDINLTSTLSIKEVAITAKQQTIAGQYSGRMDIDPLKVRKLPHLFGEPDLLRSLQLLPGVTPGSEGTSNLYVRGGSPDQNLILIDDAPIYYVSHVGGFVSIFDLNAIQKVTLWKGGFPARYGGRLSSILDIRLKEGDKFKRKLSLDFGILASKLYLELPIIKGKSSLQFSARRSLIDLLYRGVQKISKSPNRNGYTLNDVNTKYSHVLNKNNRLYFSFYSGGDKILTEIGNNNANDEFKFTNKAKIKWGNMLGVARWHTIINEKWSVNSTTYLTQFNYETLFVSEKKDNDNATLIKEENRFKSSLRDVAIKTDVEYYHSSKITLRFGGGVIANKFSPFLKSLKANYETGQIDTIISDQKVNGFEKYLYAEFEYNPIKKLRINGGLRTIIYSTAANKWNGLQPRFSARYSLNSVLSVDVSISQMQQFLHLLSNNSTGLPTDFWVPATSTAKPENAWQQSIGANFVLQKGWVVSIETYFKKMQNLIEYKEGVSLFTGNPNWQEKIESGGVGIAKGIEILLEKTEGKITGWIGYTLSSNQRKFSSLNKNNFFPYRYDRPHNLSVIANVKLSERKNFSFSWVYYTGAAITMATSKNEVLSYDFKYEKIPYILGFDLHDAHIYNERNSFRMPNYHRLDLSYTIRKNLKKGYREWNFGFYNLYNRKNPYFLFFNRDSSNGLKLFQYSLFPILPSLSLHRNF